MLSELLKRPPRERAELAMALWESLSDAERDQDLELTVEQAAESSLDGSRPASGVVDPLGASPSKADDRE